jgi:hypothetical protein
MESNIWIVKVPSTSMSKELKFITKSTDLEAYRNSTESYVVQKYLSNPFLFEGRKLEARFHVLITSIDPLRIYLVSPGPNIIFKTNNAKFTLDPQSFTDPVCTHFNPTNYSVCTDCVTGKERCGYYNQYHVHNTLCEAGFDLERFQRAVDDIIIKIILAVQPKLKTLAKKVLYNRYNSFHLIAVDFLIDEEFKPILLEVNSNPDLGSVFEDGIGIEASNRPVLRILHEVLNVAGFHLPPDIPAEALRTMSHDEPQTLVFNESLYSWKLTRADNDKRRSLKAGHERNAIDKLTRDDIKQLIISEDELSRTDRSISRRLFPTTDMYLYNEYVANLLLSTWESIYAQSSNRSEAVQRLLSVLGE